MKEDDKEDDPASPFWLDLLYEMIRDTKKQPEGVELVKERPGEP